MPLKTNLFPLIRTLRLRAFAGENPIYLFGLCILCGQLFRAKGLA